MLTKLEVNGFKNLLNFETEFGPYVCIAGLNGIGKSNIFDAIQFLSFLSDHSLNEAALLVRDSTGDGEPSDIFYTDGIDRVDTISIAAEMLVNPKVTDEFGIDEEASSTYLRYEIELGYLPAAQKRQSRIFIKKEELNYKKKGDATQELTFPMSASQFRDIAITNKRKGAGYITTSLIDDITVINIHQDGGSSGQPQKIPAEKALKTVIANTNSSTTPTILAARREMQSWRFMALEPTSMRRSNKYHDPATITKNGDFLASTLNKLIDEDKYVLTRIASRLSDIIPVNSIKIDSDEARQTLTLSVREQSGAYIPARSLSDGTLRFLTLCIMASDYDFHGLLCFEEPENGIHPAKIGSMLSLIKDLTVDTSTRPSKENPMRQVIVATHSPTLVQLQKKDDLLYVDSVRIKGPFGRLSTTVQCFALPETWRSRKNFPIISQGSILSYLAKPINTQLELNISSDDE